MQLNPHGPLPMISRGGRFQSSLYKGSRVKSAGRALSAPTHEEFVFDITYDWVFRHGPLREVSK
jgi:hypothetical protein